MVVGPIRQSMKAIALPMVLLMLTATLAGCTGGDPDGGDGTDGIDLEIYKRCGWTKPIENISEEDELIIRKEWTEGKVSKKYYELFNNLCESYEKEIWKP